MENRANGRTSVNSRLMAKHTSPDRYHAIFDKITECFDRDSIHFRVTFDQDSACLDILAKHFKPRLAI